MEKKEEFISFDREILKNPRIKIFSKSEGDRVKYFVSLDSNDDVQNHEERIAIASFEQGSPRGVKYQIEKLFKIISGERVEKTDVEFSIKQLKKDSDIDLTEEMQKIIEICSDRAKKDLEQIQIKRTNKMEDLLPKSMDYRKIDKTLNTEKREEPKIVSKETVQQVESDVKERLTVLDSIKTNRDARSQKESLESFMMYQESTEKQDSREKILLKFIEKIDELDAETIIATLKAIEDTDIKYSKLYPIYLRIQEKRVIKKVQIYLTDLKSRHGAPDGKIEEFLEELEKQKMQDLKGKELNGVISGFIGDENEQLAEYLRNGRKVDFEIMRYINSIENVEKPDEKEEVLNYMKHRIASIRQLGKGFKKYQLRTFIEDTQFKDEDEIEQNAFLQEVAEIEKKHLLSKYGELLKKYKPRSQEEPQSLREYNSKLTQKEEEKRKLQELYQGYNRLIDDRNKGKGEKGRDGQ